MHTEDVLLVIRGYQRRMEHWDDLLVNLARNTVAPPMKSKKQVDVSKMRLYQRAADRQAESKLKDPEHAAAWLKALKQRGR